MSLPPPPGATIPTILDALARAGVGVVMFGYRGRTLEKLYANEVAIAPLGYTPEEWFAKAAYELIPADQRPAITSLYDRLSAGAPAPPVIELTLVHKDGRPVRREYAVARGELVDGSVFVLIARDDGPHTKTPLSLLEADRVAVVGALAAGFAHETNNPLTSVLLNLRTLRKQVVTNLDGAAQAAALRCLDDITTGSERIASNVRALQTLATRSATQQIDLAAVVSSALRLAAPTLEPRARVIRQIFPVPAVVGEESRIGQAVLAMLLFSCSGFDQEQVNASDRIVVAVEEREARVVVEVSDNGRELTAQDVERAYDPFFRSLVRGAGVGVGLGIARSVANTLGGEVTLAARAGGGAVITMSLPVAPRA